MSAFDCMDLILSGQLVCLRSYPGYLVSTDGRVWTSWKAAGKGHGMRIDPDRIHPKKGTVGSNGYVGILLSGRFTHVHRLILEAFIGPCPPGMQACHFNGDRTDNRLDNLRWDTSRENHRDRAIHGTSFVGSRHPRSKLTESDIPMFFRLKIQGLSNREIADTTGMSIETVRDILNRRSWKHVPID